MCFNMPRGIGTGIAGNLAARIGILRSWKLFRRRSIIMNLGLSDPSIRQEWLAASSGLMYVFSV